MVQLTSRQVIQYWCSPYAWMSHIFCSCIGVCWIFYIFLSCFLILILLNIHTFLWGRYFLKKYSFLCYNVLILSPVLWSDFDWWISSLSLSVLGNSERHGGEGDDPKHNYLNFKVKISHLFITPQTTVFFFLLSVWIFFSCLHSMGVFRKKRDKNGHLLGFVPHTYFILFDLFMNICTLFRSTLLY